MLFAYEPRRFDHTARLQYNGRGALVVDGIGAGAAIVRAADGAIAGVG